MPKSKSAQVSFINGQCLHKSPLDYLQYIKQYTYGIVIWFKFFLNIFDSGLVESMLMDLMTTQAKQSHLGTRDMAEAGRCAVCCRAAWTLSPVRRGSQHNADRSLCRPQSEALVLRRNLSHTHCLVLSMNCNKQSMTLFIMCFHIFSTLISALSFYWSCIKEEAWEHHCVPWSSQVWMSCAFEQFS